MSKPQGGMELTEKLGSNVTLSNGILGEMSSRLEILHCENGRSDGKPMKKQYDRAGHETGNGHPQPDHPTSYVFEFFSFFLVRKRIIFSGFLLILLVFADLVRR